MRYAAPEAFTRNVSSFPLIHTFQSAMHNSLSSGPSKFVASLGLIAMAQFGFALPSFGQYQGNEGDIVVIGETPDEWARFRSYWQELLQLNPPPQAASSETAANDFAEEEDPAEIEARLKKNLVVTGLEQKAILRLSGSSQVTGKLQNKNKVPVTVSSVSFEIIDKDGELVRSGAATPQPGTIAPGGMVTFSVDLFGVPKLSSNKVRLTESPFVIQGGV